MAAEKIAKLPTLKDMKTAIVQAETLRLRTAGPDVYRPCVFIYTISDHRSHYRPPLTG